jgi:hypothetical protein
MLSILYCALCIAIVSTTTARLAHDQSAPRGYNQKIEIPRYGSVHSPMLEVTWRVLRRLTSLASIEIPLLPTHRLLVSRLIIHCHALVLALLQGRPAARPEAHRIFPLR